MRVRSFVATLGLALGLALGAPAPSSAAARRPRLDLVPRLWGTGEVRLVDASGAHRLERFTEPQAIVGTEISPDGRRAYVWHLGARPPRRLSVYDLASRTRLADFAPGFGGELHFTPAGNLVHTWGCGSNCHGYALYDASGRTLFRGVTAGAEVSPARRYLVTSSSLL
ncbi:MAG TPA: hypothetical protein VHB21_23270, partial [Minicystis sp.]|nr:hypothetical protein [Minicystis sp.]